MEGMIATILAGGKGSRMDMLCQVRAKPALPFAGKYKFIDFCLSNCLHSQISDMAVLVDYKREQLSDYVSLWQRENAKNVKIDLLTPDNNGVYTGTANALYQQRAYFENVRAERVLIMPSDHAYKMDYRKMLAFHAASGADVTVGVVPVPIEEAHRFGTMIMDPAGRVTDYVEKPDIPKSNLVSMGIYIFNKDVLLNRLQEDAAKVNSLHDFGYSIIPGMVGRDKVFAYQFKDFWRDVGTIESYYDTNIALASQKPPLNLNGNWPVITVKNTAKPIISNKAVVKNSIIGPGCVIKGRVENSVLSAGVHVDEQAEVKNSILFTNVVVGVHTNIDACIADEDVNIGNFCYIGFGNDRSGIQEYTILGKGASISSHTAIARGCKIMPFTNPSDSFKKVFINEYDQHRIPSIIGHRDSQNKVSA